MPVLTMHANGQTTKLAVGKFTPSSVDAQELVSADVGNQIQLGSDGKLFVAHHLTFQITAIEASDDVNKS